MSQKQILLLFFFLHILVSLLFDLSFHFLNHVESTDEVLFEETFDVVSYYLDVMVSVIDFTEVQLVLNCLDEPVVVVFAVIEIMRTSSFFIWSLELKLIF